MQDQRNGMTDLEIIAQVWIDDEEKLGSGDLHRAVVEVERSDRDEIRVGIDLGDGDVTHVYLAPDRAVRLAQALIFEASREYRI